MAAHLGDALIAVGLARPYSGGERDGWLVRTVGSVNYLRDVDK
jgi:hypothetical protein